MDYFLWQHSVINVISCADSWYVTITFINGCHLLAIDWKTGVQFLALGPTQFPLQWLPLTPKKFEHKRQLGPTVHRWEDNIQMDLREI